MKNLTVQACPECRCEFCKPAMVKMLINATLGLAGVALTWFAVRMWRKG